MTNELTTLMSLMTNCQAIIDLHSTNDVSAHTQRHDICFPLHLFLVCLL